MLDLENSAADSQHVIPSRTAGEFLGSWRELDGLRGCFTGRQTLGRPFWLLGVGATVLITVTGSLASKLLGFQYFLDVLTATTVLLACSRACAWYCIVKCRRNTSSELFTALALMIVVVDIVYGLMKWPTILLIMLLR
jgi:hypothetical protein